MSREKGDIAEKKAINFLLEQNFRVVDKNFYSRFGEIDIIAIKDDVLHFIEVKSALSYEVAVNNITPKKISKLIKTAKIYMKKNNLNLDFCFDAIIITPEDIDIIENILI